jgi:hypothetical protein
MMARENAGIVVAPVPVQEPVEALSVVVVVAKEFPSSYDVLKVTFPHLGPV